MIVPDYLLRSNPAPQRHPEAVLLGGRPGVGFGHGSGEPGFGEPDRASRNQPRQAFDPVQARADRWILLFEQPGPFRVHGQDAQPAVNAAGLTQQWAGGQQVAGLMQVGQVCHVGVLQCILCVLVKDRRVVAMDQQRDGDWSKSMTHIVSVRDRAGEAGPRRPGMPRCYANGPTAERNARGTG
jgi:hypothetical protein